MRIVEINEAAFCLSRLNIIFKYCGSDRRIMSRLQIFTLVLMLFFSATNFSVGGDEVDQRCYCYDMNPRHKVPIFLGIYYVDLKQFQRSNESSTWPNEKTPSWRLRPKYLTANFLHTKKSY